MQKDKLKQYVDSYMHGFVIGDIMGLPYQFKSKQQMQEKPCGQYFSNGGFYNQECGTWSGNTSLVLATMGGIDKDSIDYDKIMENFVQWYKCGKFTINGNAFDIRMTTKNSILKFINGEDPFTCGATSENSNQNDALVRIAPLTFFLRNKFGKDFMTNPEIFPYIKHVVGLTNAHMTSVVACAFYISLLNEIINCDSLVFSDERDKKIAIIKNAFKVVRQNKNIGIYDEIEYFDDFDDIKQMYYKPFSAIEGNGLIMDSLEISIMAFLRYNDAMDGIINTINRVANDTTANTALVGGILNLYKQDEDIMALYDTIPFKKKISSVVTRYENRLLLSPRRHATLVV